MVKCLLILYLSLAFLNGYSVPDFLADLFLDELVLSTEGELISFTNLVVVALCVEVEESSFPPNEKGIAFGIGDGVMDDDKDKDGCFGKVLIRVFIAICC